MRLGNYKGLHMPQPDIRVTEKDVMDVLKRKQKEYAVAIHIDDRCAQAGDQAILDFEGNCNGKPFPHNIGQNFALHLGVNAFLPEFDQAIIGRMPGDTFDIDAVFPNDYRIREVRSLPVSFRTTLKKLRKIEYQPLDDEFAQDFSEHDALSDWKAEIYENLKKRRETSAQERLSNDLLDRIIVSSDIPIDPEIKVEMTAFYYEDFLDQLEENGVSLELYCRRSGKDEKALYEMKEKEAIRAIQTQSILHAVAAAEQLSLTAEEISEELKAIAWEEEEPFEEFCDSLDEEELDGIKDQLLMNKAMEFILNSAVLEPQKA